jgi:hypothetical protein
MEEARRGEGVEDARTRVSVSTARVKWISLRVRVKMAMVRR